MSEVMAIFLRGVNLGGRTVKSADLAACLDAIDGITGVKTVLATGNALVRTDLDASELKARTEAALREAFGFDTWVVVLSRAELADLMKDNPYPTDDPKRHCYLTFTSDPAALDAWEKAARELDQPCVRLSPDAFAWPCPKGDTLSLPFAVAQTRAPLRQFQNSVTTRNARTIEKMLAATVVQHDLQQAGPKGAS